MAITRKILPKRATNNGKICKDKLYGITVGIKYYMKTKYKNFVYIIYLFLSFLFLDFFLGNKVIQILDEAKKKSAP